MMRPSTARGTIDSDSVYSKAWTLIFQRRNLISWSAFDIDKLSLDISLEYGSTCIAALAKKHEAILNPQSMEAITHSNKCQPTYSQIWWHTNM